MPDPIDPLKNVRIASPCPTSWERMAGDERVRYCTVYELNVYNFAELSRAEIRELLERNEGRVCVRLYRRADGTMLTKDCPSALDAVRRRVSRFGAATAAALLSVFSFASGCTTGSRSKASVEVQAAPAGQQLAVFTGSVVNEGASIPLPGVTIVLKDEAGHERYTAVTDASGSFTMSSLSERTYRVETTFSGFRPAVLSHVTLKKNQVARAQMELAVDMTDSIVVGALAVWPIEDATMTTTFTQNLIDKLPR